MSCAINLHSTIDTMTGMNPKDILYLDDRTPFLDIAGDYFVVFCAL